MPNFTTYRTTTNNRRGITALRCLSRAFARRACSLRTVGPSLEVHVRCGQSVSFRAVRLSRVHGGQSLASKNVYALGHEIKVSRVHARLHATEMVKYTPLLPLPFRDRPEVFFVRDTMGARGLSSDRALTVSPSLVDCPLPQPTRSKFGAVHGNRTMLVDLRPKGIHHRCYDTVSLGGN